MSDKSNREHGISVLRSFLLLFAFFAFIETGRAKTVNVRLVLETGPAPFVSIEGEYEEGTTAWSFRNTYAGLVNLAGRIEDLNFKDVKKTER